MAMAEYVRDVFRETRSDLRDDWQRQERDQAALHGATVDLFESLQTAHSGMRLRVRREMLGLALVMAGTVVSAL